jgi:predicted AlkP superfamily pyrophosphatase or phosphodiesterase
MRLLPASFTLAAALAFTATTPMAPAAAQSGPPTLVVAISVDQFSADLFAQYRRHFTGGFARLQEGAVFPSAFQSHAATETCPGHSTLLTGVHPSRSGIIANNWYNPEVARAEKRIYCAEDETDPASTSTNPVVSAVHLRVPTLGERLKAVNSASRNVAVSAKDRAVMMMGGHTIDEAYWWKNGQFVTLAGRALARPAVEENAAVAKIIKSGAAAMAAPAWCNPRNRAVTAGKTGNISFGTWRFALEADKPDAFRVSPRMDAATFDLASRLAETMQLGGRGATDVLSVSLSATDYIGHGFGNEGMEMCLQLAELDKSLGSFLARLDARHVDYVVMLSADHGGLDAPERLDEQALPGAARVDPALNWSGLAKAVTAKTGITTTGPLLYSDGMFGDFYIARNISSAQRAAVSAALVEILKGHPQVAAVFTAQELAEAPNPTGNPQDWSLKDRARASFDAQRSGDVVMLLDRAIVPIPAASWGYLATHGSAWDYDRRVPLLFWRRGMAGFEQPAPVETVDIAPTLAAMIGLAVPEGAFDGRCLDIDGSAGNSCGGVK